MTERKRPVGNRKGKPGGTRKSGTTAPEPATIAPPEQTEVGAPPADKSGPPPGPRPDREKIRSALAESVRSQLAKRATLASDADGALVPLTAGGIERWNMVTQVEEALGLGRRLEALLARNPLTFGACISAIEALWDTSKK